MKKEVIKFQVRNRDIQDRLSTIYEKQAEEKRELTAEESAEISQLKNEFEANRREILLSNDAEAIANMRMTENKNVALREFFKSKVENRTADNVILLSKSGDNVTNTIENSGAIALHIEELIDTTAEGLDLPEGITMQTGVTGNELWPISINDVECEEPDEVAELNDQKLDFANITPTPHRVGLTLPVSFAAIDNAAFDLYGFITRKFQKAVRTYIAKKYYWPGVLTGNKGPFSGMTPGSLDLTSGAQKKILLAVAKIAKLGIDGDIILSFDKEVEAVLKCTPIQNGAAAGFVIQNGLCAGYKYTTSNFVNGNNANKHYLEISTPDYFALQQHGQVRFTVDTISQAKKNVMQLTLNTFYSMTELSNKLNGNQDGKPQAFALYEVTIEEEESNASI